MENNLKQNLPEEYREESDKKKRSRGPIREQMDNVGESGKNIFVFFFKEFYTLIIYFINYFKNRHKK